MFTGIVEETGQVLAFAPAADAWRLEVSAERTREGVAPGDSIAVNGCCLTLVAAGPDRLRFDVIGETRRLTNFSELRPGAAVNLERSLRSDGRFGGHFVAGHVDGLGRILILERRGQDTYLQIQAPAGGGRYLIPKGSIAIDGVALTLAEVADDVFAVWLIPHTLAATNLREHRAGDAVNLEYDLLGKYVEKLLNQTPCEPRLTP
jgi:riboflavin synthase